jgi:predicted transcriptional regulator
MSNLRDIILWQFRLGVKSISKKDFNVIHTYFYSTVNNLINEGILGSQTSLKDSRERIYVLTKKGNEMMTKAYRKGDSLF